MRNINHLSFKKSASHVIRFKHASLVLYTVVAQGRNTERVKEIRSNIELHQDSVVPDLRERQ